MPADAWSVIAAELRFLLRNQQVDVERPARAALLHDTLEIAGVEAGTQLTRTISQAASAMRPVARLALWHELWYLLKDERPLPADLAAAINTLPYDEEWL